ncbi:hypothetical protein C8Q80DRAFT_189479 [Daedaleopsis nitida]|nr:hypothetical protein C8Q80DRAFT_189479 [Daedaleopsis nitida]
MYNVVCDLQSGLHAPTLRSSLSPISANRVSHIAKALRHDPAKSSSQREREADAREHWYTHTHDARLEARYRELEDVWVNFPSEMLEEHDQDLLPNRHDGGRLFDDVVTVEPEAARVPVDEDRVLTAHDDINELVDEYIDSVITCLSDPVPLTPKRLSHTAGKGSKPPLREPRRRDSSTTVLMRAYALFRCRHPTCEADGTPPTMFPVIHEHWREAHPDRSIWAIECDLSGYANGTLHL